MIRTALTQKSGVINKDSVKRVAVDTTVMEKNIVYPTDARLYERAAINWRCWRKRLEWI